MKIDVIGCGSAFSKHSNTSSIRIIDSQENQWLVDCGPTVPRAIWQRDIGVNEIQVIYFTHIHPDHCSGLAALINQWKSFKRTEPLTIFCQTEQKEPLEALVALSIWPEKVICFEIHWQEISDSFEWRHWKIDTANTQHEISNRALRITAEQQTLFFSGDGRPTVASKKLMNKADIAFQECASFTPLPHNSSHGDLPDCERLLVETDVKILGLYHLFDEVIPKVSEVVQCIPRLFLSKDGLFIDLEDENYIQKIQTSTLLQ
ncbi:MBL fold metallo-hydrolase [Psychromonas arctica]|uniref:MBL fold metallo-hydrolase n=1 Tax=Psychromonas arctica TaxID=168275 RepID=UPI00040BB454|nr:ribonuclease Z [Psychromonas arctica]